MLVAVQDQVESVSAEHLQQVATINDGVIASPLLDQVRNQDRVVMYKRNSERRIMLRKGP